VNLPLEQLLVGASALIVLSIVASKLSGRVGLPALILFLLVGVLAGSEGIGGIEFEDPLLAQSLGIVALAYILFSGGLDTGWRAVRPILGPGVALATVAVVLTSVTMGVASMLVLGLPLLHGLLLTFSTATGSCCSRTRRAWRGSSASFGALEARARDRGGRWRARDLPRGPRGVTRLCLTSSGVQAVGDVALVHAAHRALAVGRVPPWWVVIAGGVPTVLLGGLGT
jgi:hypothetical protein